MKRNWELIFGKPFEFIIKKSIAKVQCVSNLSVVEFECDPDPDFESNLTNIRQEIMNLIRFHVCTGENEEIFIVAVCNHIHYSIGGYEWWTVALVRNEFKV